MRLIPVRHSFPDFTFKGQSLQQGLSLEKLYMKRILMVIIILPLVAIWLYGLFVFGGKLAENYYSGGVKNFANILSGSIPKFYVVQSGSMEPAVGVGSIVIVYPSDLYNSGDIISFSQYGNLKNTITHRIAEKREENGHLVYLTKGDANDNIDLGYLDEKNIIGKVRLTIPYLGYLASAAKKPWGFVLLVIVPATILIYEEIKIILGINHRVGESHVRRGDNVPTPRKKTKNILHKLFRSSVFVMPVFGAGLVFTSVSASFFSDKEVSAGNFFQAASSFGTPTPEISLTPTPIPIAQTLVINEVLPLSDCKMGNNSAWWIELFNGYDYTVNLKNYKLSDGENIIDTVTAHNVEIPPGGFALLAHDSSIWVRCYGDNGVPTVNLGGRLDIDTGHLQLIDPAKEGLVIDDVRWGDGVGLYLDPLINESIERNPDGLDTAFGTDYNTDDFIIRSPPAPGY